MDDLLIDPVRLTLPWSGGWQPLGFVDFHRAPIDLALSSLPPFPLIGIGDLCHPLAAQVDVVLEPPLTADMLLAQVIAQPEAAAVAVNLLRLIAGLAPERALVAESLAYGLLQGSAGHGRWLAARTAGPRAEPGVVQVTRADDRLTITMDRPHAHNAIDRAMRDGLREAFELAALDPTVTSVRLVGAGRTFSTGADLAEFGTTRDPATAHVIRMQTLSAHAIVGCAGKLEAHVQGACVGAGLEMAAFARRLTASARAWFHLPELAMGLLPGAGGCVSLSRRIGRQRTGLLLLSGRRIGARTALDWGLVDALVDDVSTDGGHLEIGGDKP